MFLKPVLTKVFPYSGTFVWIDGTNVAATGSHWRTASGEPNNWGGNEDCTEMHFDGKWNDNGCFREFAFICKKNKSERIKLLLICAILIC